MDDFLSKVYCEGVVDPTSSAGTDMGVWSVCCQPEYSSLCLALHHLQLSPGLSRSMRVLMHTEYYASLLQGVSIFAFHVLRNDRV